MAAQLHDERRAIIERAKQSGLLFGKKNSAAPPAKQHPPQPIAAGPAKQFKLSIQIETIAPEQAEEWLSQFNKLNRKVKWSTVTAYARDMKRKKWLITHQAIAFNDRGELLDGQHRLHAVIEAKLPVQMLVIRGVPSEQSGEKTMDAVDRGVTRSIADQLGLHGFEDANLIAGMCRMVAQIGAADYRVQKLTMSQTMAVLQLYQEHAKAVLGSRVKTHGLKSALFLGCVCFARPAAPKLIDEFFHSANTGENLQAGSPALAARNWLMGGGAIKRGKSNAIKLAEMLLHALHCHVTKQPLQALVWNRTGAEFFRGKQDASVKAIVALFA